MNDSELAIANIAIDYWKLLRSFEKMVDGISDERAPRLQAQARFSSSRLTSNLNELGLQLSSYDGEELTASLPALAVNAEELGGAEQIFVESTIEPAVLAGVRVILASRVVAVARGM